MAAIRKAIRDEAIKSTSLFSMRVPRSPSHNTQRDARQTNPKAWGSIETRGENLAMQRLHILGRKNHGKTTLVCELIEQLVARGWRIGSVKHTHHHHELDTPGKDSHRHRQAGARVVGILSPKMNAVFWAPDEPAVPPDASRYAALLSHMSDCDLVLVEGDSQTTGDKIEVWRAERNTPPIANDDASILAIVSDDQPPCHQLRLPRQELASLIAWIESRYTKR